MTFYTVEDAAATTPAATAPTAPLPPVVARYQHPWLFYGIATAIPWALWFTAGWISHHPDALPVAPAWVATLGVLGLITPLVIAARLVSRDPALIADTRRRLTNIGSVGARHWVLALLILPASLLAATAVSVLLGYSPDQFLPRGTTSFTAGALNAFVVIGVAAVVEELAWKGYGTDALASRWSLWRTTCVFTVIWALWHLPLSSINGYYQAELVETGWLATVTFLGSILPFMVIMNWLYYRAHRCIWVPVVFHLSANYGNELLATHPDTKAIQAVMLVVLAGIIVWRERKLFFTRPEAACPPPSAH